MKKLYSLLAIAAIGFSANAQIVINEVYGGGGNAGATLKQDFIELKNIGTTAASLTNATIQYASAAGTFNAYHTIPNVSLQPGQSYLIQEGQGATGTIDLPNPDLVVPENIAFLDGKKNTGGFAMSATNGKVALVNGIVQITGPKDAVVLDFVGFGTASQYEGSAAAAAPTNTTSISRTSGDTNDNAADFATGTPTPVGTLAVSDVAKGKATLVKNSLVANELQFAAKGEIKIVNVNGQVVKAASVNDGTILNVSNLAKGMYIVTGNVNGENVSQKIIKK